MKLSITLNGTDTNPYHKLGLRMNPFPQIPKQELNSAMMAINSLDAEPLKGPEDIEARLMGFSQEFIDICKERFVPGERVRFEVILPDGIDQ